MREILFRGKRIDNGEWIYGDLNTVQYKNSKYIAYTDTTGKRHCIQVMNNTIGEYTGLNDRNRKPIFEGDIVECTDVMNGIKFTARIVFGNPNRKYSWGYQLKHIKGDKANLDILLWVDMEDTGTYIEVIGNIHDNPKLLNNT